MKKQQLLQSGHPIKRQPKVIGLFSGVRGGEHGAELDGWDSVYSCDWEKDAQKVFYANNKTGIYHVADISTLTGDQVFDYIADNGGERYKKGEMDCVLSTASCQDVSRSNPVRKCLSERANLLTEQLRVIDDIYPWTFYIENVDSYFDVLNEPLQRQFETALNSMKGYNVKMAVLTPMDYGGRQHRPRLTVVGIRKDLGIEFSYPTPQPIDYSKVSFHVLFPHLDGFASGQSTKRYKNGYNQIFGTLVVADDTIVYEYGTPRKFNLAERLKLSEMEHMDLTMVSNDFQKTLTGNILPPSLSRAVFHQLRTEILYKSLTWK